MGADGCQEVDLHVLNNGVSAADMRTELKATSRQKKLIEALKRSKGS